MKKNNQDNLEKYWDEVALNRNDLTAVMSIRWTSDQCQNASDALFLRIKNLLNFCTNSKNLLDIGCGIGRMLSRIEQSRIDLELKGMDLSEEMLKRAELNLKSSKLFKADICQLSNEKKVNLRSDIVLVSTVLGHIPDINLKSAVDNIKEMASKYIIVIEEMHSYENHKSPYCEDRIRSLGTYLESFAPWQLLHAESFLCIDDAYYICLFVNEKRGRF